MKTCLAGASLCSTYCRGPALCCLTTIQSACHRKQVAAADVSDAEWPHAISEIAQEVQPSHTQRPTAARTGTLCPATQPHSMRPALQSGEPRCQRAIAASPACGPLRGMQHNGADCAHFRSITWTRACVRASGSPEGEQLGSILQDVNQLERSAQGTRSVQLSEGLSWFDRYGFGQSCEQ